MGDFMVLNTPLTQEEPSSHVNYFALLHDGQHPPRNCSG